MSMFLNGYDAPNNNDGYDITGVFLHINCERHLFDAQINTKCRGVITFFVIKHLTETNLC